LREHIIEKEKVSKILGEDPRLDELTRKVILGEEIDPKDYINLKRIGAGG
jgi:hypothetical protein